MILTMLTLAEVAKRFSLELRVCHEALEVAEGANYLIEDLELSRGILKDEEYKEVKDNLERAKTIAEVAAERAGCSIIRRNEGFGKELGPPTKTEEALGRLEQLEE